MVDLLFGQAVLVTGVEDQPEGWLKVYIGARWKNLYVVVIDPEDQRRIRRAWKGAIGHVTIPKPDPSEVFSDEFPYEPEVKDD